MTQVHIARFAGANTPQNMGPCIWQMIWFSLLSMVITVPATLIYGHYYFLNIPIRDIALPYLYLMAAGNFLFPLGAALSCYYLCNKRGKELLQITLLVQSIGFLLAYLLIFGLPPLLPPLGLIGAGIAFLSTQLLLCLILLRNFLRSTTSSWKLRPSLLWEYLRPGLIRSFSTASTMAAWSALSYIIIHTGNDFLLILSIGCAVWEMFSVFSEGLLQLLTTEISHILGSNHRSHLNHTFRIGLLFASGISTFIALPLLLFPNYVFPTFFPTLALPATSLFLLGLGLWACFTFDAINVIGLSYILSFKDTFQLFLRAIIAWIFEMGCAYLLLKNLSPSAPYLWLIISPGLFCVATANFLRAFVLIRKDATTLLPEKDSSLAA